MEARIWELEKAPQAKEVIDVDTAVENMMVVFEAIKSLRKDTKDGWKKLIVRNMVFFELFLCYFSRLSMLFYPSHVLFSQFHSSRKDNTRAIDPIT